MLPREPSEAGPGLPAPPRSKPLRFRHSGSPQRRRLGWACVLCSSQIRAAQVMRCLAGANAATYRLPAARSSGCTTGAHSQADVDCPEPQEVLVSKEACLQFCRYCLSGAAIAPFWLWLPVTGGGWSAAGYLFSPLFCARAWGCLRLGLAFRVVNIPQSGLLAQIILLR